MKVKLFADQCMPRSIITAIEDAGFEALKLSDHIPQDSPDPVVIAKAQELDCVLLSLNGDFADIVTYPPGKYKGIVALQIRNHPESMSRTILRLLTYLGEHQDAEHYEGKLFVVEAHRIRVQY
jgi:predicted nuclease of predicted toxin-antitoxin system